MADLNILEIYYAYYLRRPDKIDPLDPYSWQPFYAGKGSNGRLYVHRQEALNLLINPNGPNSNPIRNYIIHNLWSQGLDFVEEIMFDNLTEQDALDCEMEAISVYGRIDLKTGCLANLTPGGNNPPVQTRENMTEEQRIARSERWKGDKNPNYNRVYTEEEIEVFRMRSTGKVHSEETKQQMSVSQKKRDYHPSEEVRQNTSRIQKNRIKSEEETQKLSDTWKEKYANGYVHHMQDKHHSEESKLQMSESAKGREVWNTGLTVEDERVAKNVKAAHDAWTGQNHTEEVISIISEAAKRNWEDPNYRKTISDGSKRLWADPEYREKQRLARERTRRLKEEKKAGQE